MKSLNTRKILTAIIIGSIFTSSSYAGIFEDDEARKFILEQKKSNEERFKLLEDKIKKLEDTIDNSTKNQMTFNSELQGKEDTIRKLNGQLELLNHELDIIKKSQKDLYLDLDGRVDKFEKEKKEKEIVAEKASQDYEDALNKFKEQKFKEASWGFAAFLQKNPTSPQKNNAIYWLGNSFYALGNCQKAIPVYEKLANESATTDKHGDALLQIAQCQMELGKNKEAKNTLETVLKDHPKSNFADEAHKKLKSLKKDSNNKKK